MTTPHTPKCTDRSVLTRLFKVTALDVVDGEMGEMYPIYVVVQDPMLVSPWQVAREVEARILKGDALVSIEAIRDEVIVLPVDAVHTSSPEALVKIAAMDIADGERTAIYAILWGLPCSPLSQVIEEIEATNFGGAVLWGIEILDGDLVALPVQEKALAESEGQP